MAELEKDAVRRAKYLHAAARILRDEVKSLDESIEFFNRALDDYFREPERLTAETIKEYLKAFESIDRICTNQKDFKSQERAYRRMFKRMPQEGYLEIKAALLHALGEIYRSRLKEYKTAMETFELANRLDPTNLSRHEILAELYLMAGPEHAEKAVGEHLTILRYDHLRASSYKALRRLYMQLQQFDRAWCVSQALAYLKQADAEEMQFFEQYRTRGLARARGRLSDELWANSLRHPDEDLYISAVFAAIWQAVAGIRAVEHKQVGLKRKERRDLSTDQTLFAKVFTYSAQVLTSSQVEVYFRPDQAGGAEGMAFYNLREKNVLTPSLVVFNSLLQGRGDKEVAYEVGRFLTKLRPDHLPRLCVQTNGELRVAFLAAIKLVQPNFQAAPQEAAAVAQYLEMMRAAVQPAWLEQLVAVVKHFTDQQSSVDLQRWSQAMELTAQRAGFVLCNDLQVAADLIQVEAVTVGSLPSKEKIRELVLYSVSPLYYEVRQQLGLALA